VTYGEVEAESRLPRGKKGRGGESLTRTVRALATYFLLVDERESRRTNPFLERMVTISVEI
jgi:hypothetical protein